MALNEGAGWDGTDYREMVLHLEDLIPNNGIDKYHMHRLFPFAFVYYGIKGLGFDLNNYNALIGCSIANFICICLTVFYFFKISRFVKWSLQVELMGFAMSFINVPILKIAGYYPFLTDYMAYLLSYMTVYYFITHNTPKLCITGLVSLFTWPLLGVVVYFLALFPRDSVKSIHKQYGYYSKINKIIQLFFVLWIPVLFWLFVMKQYVTGNSLVDDVFFRKPVNYYIVFLASLFVSFFYYRAVRFVDIDWKRLFSNLFQLKQMLVMLFGATVFYIFYNMIEFYGAPAMHSMKVQLLGFLVYPMSDIAIFVESHFIYLGLFFVLILLLWKPIFHEAEKYGIGMVLVLVLALLFLVDIETRKLVSFYPVLLFLLMNVLSRSKFKAWVPYLFVLVSMILSFFWFPINVDGIQQAFERVANDQVGREGLSLFPAQRYFMFFGPWQSHVVTYIALIIEIFIMCFIFVLHKRGYIYEYDKR